MSAGTSMSGPTTPTNASPEFRSEDSHCHGNRQLEVVSRGSKRKSGRLRVVGAQPLAHPEADQEHDEKVDDQRDRNANHVERQPHDQVALEREHHQDREEQSDQRERADPGDEARAVPLLAS